MKTQREHLIIFTPPSLRLSEIGGQERGVTLLRGAEAAVTRLRSDLVKHHLDSGSLYCKKLQ